VSFQLSIPRLLIRANDEHAARRVLARVEDASRATWDAEYLGPYWKEPAQAELRATIRLGAASFAEAVSEGLSLLGRVVAIQEVGVSEDEQTMSGMFVAHPASPSGSSVPGLEWFWFELVQS
jgi:hypothetical protein